jgi:hypothetical protein
MLLLLLLCSSYSLFRDGNNNNNKLDVAWEKMLGKIFRVSISNEKERVTKRLSNARAPLLLIHRSGESKT